MKKKLIYVGIIGLAFVLGFSGYRQVNTQELRVEGKERLYTLEEMEKLSAAIVKISTVKDRSAEISFDDDKTPIEWKTITKVQVDKVYNSKDVRIKKGDILKVAEWYADWRDLSGSYRIVSNHQYNPLSDKTNYVLFLYQESEKDYYEIIGIHQGKYNLDKAIDKNGQLKLDLNSLDIHEPDKYYTEKLKLVLSKYK